MREELKKIAPEPDEKIIAAIKETENRNAKLLSKIVAKSERKLSGDRSLLRCQEAELGNLSADALRWRTGADIAVVNGGGIRTDLPKGNAPLAFNIISC